MRTEPLSFTDDAEASDPLPKETKIDPALLSSDRIPQRIVITLQKDVSAADREMFLKTLTAKARHINPQTLVPHFIFATLAPEYWDEIALWPSTGNQLQDSF